MEAGIAGGRLFQAPAGKVMTEAMQTLYLGDLVLIGLAGRHPQGHSWRTGTLDNHVRWGGFSRRWVGLTVEEVGAEWREDRAVVMGSLACQCGWAMSLVTQVPM